MKASPVPRTPTKAGALASGKPISSTASKKLSFKDQRDLDRLPAEVERLEREIAAAETALHDPDLFMKHPDKFAGLTNTIDLKRAEKDAAEMRWLEVAEMAEQMAIAR